MSEAGATSRRGYDDSVSHDGKTSAAAVFGLVFGLSALFCALTGLLAPFAVLFGIIGLILGIVGIKMAGRPGVTGKGVAIGGIVTAVLGLLLGLTIIGGIATLLNNEGAVTRIENQLDNLKSKLPTEVPTGLGTTS
jgi:hypothetical protein